MSRSPLHRSRYTFEQFISDQTGIITPPTQLYPVTADKEVFRKWRWRVYEFRAEGTASTYPFDFTLPSIFAEPQLPFVGTASERALWTNNSFTSADIFTTNAFINAFHYEDPLFPNDPRLPVFKVSGAHWASLRLVFTLGLIDRDVIFSSIELTGDHVGTFTATIDGVDLELWYFDDLDEIPDLEITIATTGGYYSYDGIYDTDTGAVNPGRDPVAEGPV
jgi:hypothetical protein